MQAFQPSGWGGLGVDVFAVEHRVLEITRIRRGQSHCAPRSAVQKSVSLLTMQLFPLLMLFASDNIFYYGYASTHAGTLCAQVPYLCFVLLLYIHSFVTRGRCSWLHMVHSRTWDEMEGGGGSGDAIHHTPMLLCQLLFHY